MSAPAQRSFAGGELAPALYARTDQTKYAEGLRTCRNMIIRRHGSATNRAGTEFIASTKESAVTSRLIPFVHDATDITDTYVLEFGAGYLRFFQDSAAVSVSGVAAWANTTAYTVGDLVAYLGVNYYCKAAHTSATATNRPSTGSAWQTVWYPLTAAIYEIPTPYATADLSNLRFVQSGEVITIVHPSYAPRELTRVSNTRWTLTTITFGPSIDAPTGVAAAGGTAGAIRYWAVTAIKEGTLEESLAGVFSGVNLVPAAGTPTVLTWNSVAHAISYNVYRSTDGQTYGLINSAGGNPILTSDTVWSDANEVATGAVDDEWAAAPGQCRNPLAAISATVRAYDGKYTVRGRYTLVGNGDGTLTGGTTYGRVNVYYSRDGEARVLAATSDLFSVDGVATNGPTAFALTIDVPDNGYAALVIDVVPEVLPAVGGLATNATMTVDESAAPNNAVEWYGGASGFSDVNDAADLAIAPPSSPNVFAAPGDYPAAVFLFQQRRFLGGADSNRQQVRGTRIGSYASFTISTPLQADDAIAFTLVGRRSNVVKHLLDLGKLVVFTTTGAYLVEGNDAGILEPDALNPNRIPFSTGAGSVAPVEVPGSAVYVQGRGQKLHDLQPIGLDGYQGNDLTVFAPHLFDGYTVTHLAYQEMPDSVLWLVRSDGVLLGLTYLRAEGIWAWHRHDTDGTVESICVLPEGQEDALYLVVARTISGATVRYVERLASRAFSAQRDAFFVDAGKTYDGRNASATTMTLSGGSSWSSTELLTVTASAGTFTAGNVGDAIDFTAADGTRIRLTLENYTSATVMTGHVSRDVPADLQAAATTSWTLAVAKVSGLAHLEGKDVAILGDGFVVASPNNSAHTIRTVSSGIVQLGAPYGVVHVGLPFISDLETLDLDSPGPRTIKDKKQLVNKVGLFVQASRGIWAGRPDRITDDAPLAGLDERKPRRVEDYDDPPSAVTEYFEITIDGSWDNNGGILVRQVDPLPLTVLAAMTIGSVGGA